MVILAGMSWLLMLFPAVPKLGPIYRDITHFIPLDFPLLLVVPALGIDITWKRVREWHAVLAAAALGAAFLIALLIVQWPFGSFLMAHGRNWFFHTDNFVYWQPVDTERFAYMFYRAAPGSSSFATGLAEAFVAATIASLVGRSRGRWMTQVRR